jgi:D-alanyl-D-alanine carboxypeptidase
MPRHEEASRLRVVGRDTSGRIARLEPTTARAWQAMRQAAAREGVVLTMVSAYRSITRQTRLVAAKLREGATLRRILRDTAYPGHSEHHTGRAIDIGAREGPGLTVAFARTREFAWLRRHGRKFGFVLSYPRGNRHGIIYEPWHWCYRAGRRKASRRP